MIIQSFEAIFLWPNNFLSIKNFEVDGSKQNLFGLSALLMNAAYIVFL